MAIKATHRANSMERQMLDNYLGQYHSAKMKKKQLEKRLDDIKEEKKNPMQGRGYSPIPHSTTNNTNDGPAAALMIRQEEIEERIEAQKAIADKAMLNVMNVIDYLPVNSIERTILEYRYIDCKSWKEVMREAHMTRNPCNDYKNKAMDELLSFKRIQILIKEYAQECGMVFTQEKYPVKRGDRCKGQSTHGQKGHVKLHTDMIQEKRSSWQQSWEKHCTYAQE